jgi:hypothetical protein
MDAFTAGAFKAARKLLNDHAETVAANAASFASSVSGKHVSGSSSGADVVKAAIRGYGDGILLAAEALAAAVVGKCSLSLDGFQPIPRLALTVSVAGRRKTMKVDPHNLLRDVYTVLQTRTPDRSMKDAMAAMEPALSGVLATVQADALNAVQQALKDEAVTGPIRERLEKKRALDRAKALEMTRHHFKNHRHHLTEDDIVSLWREGLVGEVMES